MSTKHDEPIVNPRHAQPIVASPGKGDQGLASRLAKPTGERPRSQTPLILFTLGVLALLVVVPFLVLRPRTKPYLLRSFTAATVERATIAETVGAPGTVVARDSVDVSARVTGVLDSLDVKDGDEVKAGQVIGRIFSEQLEKAVRDANQAMATLQIKLEQARMSTAAQVRDARAKVDLAKSRVEDAEHKVALVRELERIGAEAKVNVRAAEDERDLAVRELEAARKELADAEKTVQLEERTNRLSLDQAQGNVALAERTLEQTVIRAPLSGRVVSVDSRSGQDVQVGTKLFTVISLDNVRIEGQVDEIAAGRVGVGRPVRIVTAGQEYRGRVTTVASQAVSGQNGATVKVEADFETHPQGILLNSSAGLEIQVGERVNVPTLPRGPFLSTGDERFVYVLLAPDRAERREVMFGATSADRIEVVSGLEPGERVITSSYEAFKDQTAIDVSPTGELK